MIESNLNALAFQIHGLNAKWWYDGDRALPRNKGELLMLVVTEIAEGFEGERKGLMDDKLPHRPMAEVELVDAIVRILDYAGAYGYDLDGAFREKLAYNAKRADHKAEAAKIAVGNPLECAAVRARALMIEQALQRADQAAMSGDAVAILRSYHELQGLE